VTGQLRAAEEDRDALQRTVVQTEVYLQQAERGRDDAEELLRQPEAHQGTTMFGALAALADDTA
jgi:hypothetical protein